MGTSSSDAHTPSHETARPDQILIPAPGGTPHYALDEIERQLRRFAFDLHDGPLQSCAMAETMLEQAGRSPDMDEMRAQCAAAQGLVAHAISEMRDLMADFKPEALDADGVEAMLSEYARAYSAAHGMAVAVISEGTEPVVSARSKVTLLRIVQECLTNARRHALAHSVTIRLDFVPDGIACSVADDGRGFNVQEMLAAPSGAHWGLRNMAERAALVGGYVGIASGPDSGTVVRVWLPTGASWT